jgi:hypothetical protein
MEMTKRSKGRCLIRNDNVREGGREGGRPWEVMVLAECLN